MGKMALISDLHSNIEALDAVLADIRAQGVEDIVCLGDLIGYGPNPREILRHALNWRWTLRGNHEEALLFLALDFNPEAARAIDWTRTQLNAGGEKDENGRLWNFLGDLPDVRREEGVLYVHASPRDTTREYVRPPDVRDREKMEEIFSMIDHLSFYGHTHEPGVFTQDLRFYPPSSFAHKFRAASNRKYFINIGSVGQPRDRDTRACYVIAEGDQVEFRRVEYDYRQTMQKIFDTSLIPRRFGERLEQGR